MSMPSAQQWINLGEWGKGMDEFKLPASNQLAGREIELRLADSDQGVKYFFSDAGSLVRGVTNDCKKWPVITEKYEAIQIAPEIYFVDFVKNTEPGVSVSMALDFNSRKATVITATLADREISDFSFVNKLAHGLDLSTTGVEIQHALINPLSPDEPIQVHERTTDLIGKRILYTYGRDRVYEHIYLNDRMYTWHCLKGAEAGLADTEVCRYFKITPDIYLFIWSEKIMPTFGLVLINLKEMRSNGKTFGLDITSRTYINFTMGALATFLNETKYPKNDLLN